MKTETDPALEDTALKPSHREIAQLAYFLFEERGRKHGYHTEDWLAAEAHIWTDDKHDSKKGAQGLRKNNSKTAKRRVD